MIIAAGGTFTCQGVNPWGTAITDPDRCLLATDEAVNSTSLTVDSSTEWNDGDYIAIAPTGTTYSQYEIGQMNGDAVGTTLTVDGFGGVAGGLAYAILAQIAMSGPRSSTEKRTLCNRPFSNGNSIDSELS